MEKLIENLLKMKNLNKITGKLIEIFYLKIAQIRACSKIDRKICGKIKISQNWQTE